MTDEERKRLLKDFEGLIPLEDDENSFMFPKTLLPILEDLDSRGIGYEIIDFVGYEDNKLFTIKDVIEVGEVALIRFPTQCRLEDLQRVVDTVVGISIMGDCSFMRIGGRMFTSYALDAGVIEKVESLPEDWGDTLIVVDRDGKLVYEEGTDLAEEPDEEKAGSVSAEEE